MSLWDDWMMAVSPTTVSQQAAAKQKKMDLARAQTAMDAQSRLYGGQDSSLDGINWNPQQFGPPGMATVMGQGGTETRAPATAEGLMGAGIPEQNARSLMNTGPEDYKNQREALLRQANPEPFMAADTQQTIMAPVLAGMTPDQRKAFQLNPAEASKTYADRAFPAVPATMQTITALNDRITQLGGPDNPAAKPFVQQLQVLNKQTDEDIARLAELKASTQQHLGAAAKDAAQVEQIKSGGSFTPEMGDLLGALTERGVSLPAGMRSRQQQISTLNGLLSRNGDKTPDEIADMLKSGQISFSSEKKLTQTAAGVAGKVEVAGNEIEDFAQIALDASAKVPRGTFVPMTKLFQTADENLSDPNLRTLKSYTQSIMNAYDLLGSRGGSDVTKREENRKLLMSADSPEVYAAAIKAMQTEAAVAHKAAMRAASIPDKKGAAPGNPAVTPVQTITGDAAGQAAWAALKPGTKYIDPTGAQRTKN